MKVHIFFVFLKIHMIHTYYFPKSEFSNFRIFELLTGGRFIYKPVTYRAADVAAIAPSEAAVTI